MAVPISELFCTVNLQSLIPKCGECFENLDGFLRAPYTLPCCHTFCLSCLTKQKQRKKKRKCMICHEKYTKFTANTAFLALIAEIREITTCYQRSSTFCEECGKQTLLTDTRKCYTCEFALRKMLEHPFQMCRICLECCVEHHNGHMLLKIPSGKNSWDSGRSTKTPGTVKFVRRKLKTKNCHPTLPISSTSGKSSTPSSPSYINDTQFAHHTTNSCGAEKEYMNISTDLDINAVDTVGPSCQEQISITGKTGETKYAGSNPSSSTVSSTRNEFHGSLPVTSGHNYANFATLTDNFSCMKTL